MSDDTDPKPMSFRQSIAAIADALPVDEEAERAVDRALAKHHAENPPRKMIVASKLDEANAEIERLKRRIADFDTDIVVHTGAMQERYESQLKTWKANHDQRKAERDALKVEVEQLRGTYSQLNVDYLAKCAEVERLTKELKDQTFETYLECSTQQGLQEEIRRLTKERDDARANARILAHSYENDCRPLARAVTESLAYPVVPEPVTLIPSRTHDADYTRTVLSDNEHDDYDWVDLDWCDGPVRSIALVPRDDLGRDNDMLEVRTLGWQDKHEYQHVRFEREDLQAMLDYIDGKEIRDFQDEPKARGK